MVRINTRLRATHAWFVHTKDKNYIEVSKTLLNQNKYVVTDILLHELCHWHCCVNGLDYNDFHTDFENELQNVGAMSSESTEVVNGKILYSKDALEYINKEDYSKYKERFIEYIPTANVKKLADAYA